MSILVIDVGTSGLRAAIVRPDATVSEVQYRAMPPSTPFPGLVEFDAAEMATAVLDVARAVLAGAGPVDAVGITNQRA
ncbi:MAG TPA: FGGY family carbohydrate kinase, partial [Acidimicrobiales bacterium]|nr:FGGY family carbohydrate kinase [Acidimicrobiales bacterium]